MIHAKRENDPKGRGLDKITNRVLGGIRYHQTESRSNALLHPKQLDLSFQTLFQVQKHYFTLYKNTPKEQTCKN